MLKKKKNRGGEQEFVDLAAVANEAGVAGEAAVADEVSGQVEEAPENGVENEVAETSVEDSETLVEVAGAEAKEGEADAPVEDEVVSEAEGVAEEVDEGAEMEAAFEAWLVDAVPEEERREAARRAMSVVREALREGCYDAALFDVIAKGADYDRAVEEAELAGEVRGRNASIDELMTIEEDGDGVPHPGSGGGDVGNRAPSIFDLAREVY